MNNIANVVLDGFLVRDPEFKETPGGYSLSNFTVAVNHSKKENDVSFIDIECWGRIAETSAEYLRKSSKVTVIGSLRQDRWEDAEGRARSKIKVLANHVRFDSAKIED